jgi:cytochrome d ubiquinol oxidase subunit I
MVAIGFGLIALSVLGVFFWWRGSLINHKWLLWIFVISVLGPQIANQVGWITAEVGRQPWIVYGLLRTSEALSKAVASNQIVFSLILFTIVYILLFILFIYLLDQKIKHGPEEAETIESEYEHQKQLFKNGNHISPEKS